MAAVPGDAFGNDACVRFSFATPERADPRRASSASRPGPRPRRALAGSRPKAADPATERHVQTVTPRERGARSAGPGLQEVDVGAPGRDADRRAEPEDGELDQKSRADRRRGDRGHRPRQGEAGRRRRARRIRNQNRNRPRRGAARTRAGPAGRSDSRAGARSAGRSGARRARNRRGGRGLPREAPPALRASTAEPRGSARPGGSGLEERLEQGEGAAEQRAEHNEERERGTRGST